MARAGIYDHATPPTPSRLPSLPSDPTKRPALVRVILARQLERSPTSVPKKP